MKIINKVISEDSKRKNSYLVELENGQEFLICDEDYFSEQIYASEDIDPSVLKRLSEKLLVKNALGYAIKFLILKTRSIGEMKKRLMSQGYEEGIIEKAIDYLVENNYLNDQVFAEAFSRHLSKSKKLSRKQIVYELKHKGVSEEVINDTVENNTSSDIDNAKEIILRKFKTYNLEDLKLKSKISKYLMGKGYSYDIIREVLRIDAD